MRWGFMRFYKIDGAEYPSVTTILNVTMPGLRRLSLVNANPINSVLGRTRGNNVDKLCKAYLKHEPEPQVPYSDHAYFRRLQPRLCEYVKDSCETDIQVCSKSYGYAGTVDAIAHGLTPVVLEIKTKRVVVADHTHDDLLQLAAYVQALREQSGVLHCEGELLTATTTNLLVNRLTEELLEFYFLEFLKRFDIFRSLVGVDGL